MVIVSMQKGLLLVLCAVLFGASFTVWHELLNAVSCLNLPSVMQLRNFALKSLCFL